MEELETALKEAVVKRDDRAARTKEGKSTATGAGEPVLLLGSEVAQQ